MANLLYIAKELARELPEPVGRLVPYLPFSLRFGVPFVRARRRLQWFEGLERAAQKAWLFDRMRTVVDRAYHQIPFYRRHYDAQGFHPERLLAWEDLQRIPLVTKADLQQVPLGERSLPRRGSMVINTGGTSGQPLEVVLDRHAFAREWAHMLHLWKRRDYHRTDLKLTLRGANHGALPLRYNPVHNELSVNATADRADVAEALRQVVGLRPIRYLHGYPSAVYELVMHLRDHAPEVLEALAATVRAVLYGSEFPVAHQRQVVTEYLRASSLSWYGHSEMALLAGEKDEPELYFPLHTYGLCEAVPGADGREHLVGTSYWNVTAPLIRYDTGDVVQGVAQEGLLQRFRVTEGRVGEFVVDAKGTRIPLTALVFGRHHPLFAWAKFVQVAQDQPGEVTVAVTLADPSRYTAEDLRRAFDARDVAMQFRFVVRSTPVRTAAGKVTLLVSSEQIAAT